MGPYLSHSYQPGPGIARRLRSRSTRYLPVTSNRGWNDAPYRGGEQPFQSTSTVLDAARLKMSAVPHCHNVSIKRHEPETGLAVTALLSVEHRLGIRELPHENEDLYNLQQRSASQRGEGGNAHTAIHEVGHSSTPCQCVGKGYTRFMLTPRTLSAEELHPQMSLDVIIPWLPPATPGSLSKTATVPVAY